MRASQKSDEQLQKNRQRGSYKTQAREAVKTDQASSCWTNDVKIIVKLNNARKIAICSDKDVNNLSTKGITRPPSYAAAAACNTD